MSEDKNKLEMIRHSCAHLVAAAIQKLYPEAQFGVGPVVENGFYYDIKLPVNLSDADLKQIEKQAKKMMSQNLEFVRKEVPIDEAIAFFTEKNQVFKVDLLKDLKEKGTTKLNDEEKMDVGESVDHVTLYTTGEFVDLCRGPHVANTKEIGDFKLTKLAGAYWRGNAENEQLQRVYGVSFPSTEELQAYLFMIEEAEKRDHRKIGKEMDLFSLQEVGPGFPFWHPNGVVLYNALEQFARDQNSARGYNEVKTPIILNKSLWVTSGHWEKYAENMYFTTIDEEEYAVKPMNCPGGLMIYKANPHSYKELPIRNAEFGLVHRHEMSGVLHGLFRVRSFTQDDAHSFCTPDQLEKEIVDMVEYAEDMYSAFGFTEYTIFIATKPEKYIGSDEDWENATNALKNALEVKGLKYQIKEGEGAFYGPKIEFNIKDSLGRNWQCGTIQVDYSMPSRFGATYTDNNGEEKVPVMIHRAILGSLERFLGILIEHYAGAFPVWIAPKQVHFVPVSTEKHLEGARNLAQEFKKYGIRVSIDEQDETVGKKIRKASKEKIPYILVVGDNELTGTDVTVRVRGKEEQETMPKQQFIERVMREIQEKV
ncbi:MAG: threonine--tRNA ligase [Candidatus Magasanikbacteria bacterium]